MGSPPDEPWRGHDETLHRVTLTQGFWMGVVPTTQTQWQAVMGHNPSLFRGDNLPVEQVSWDDCNSFCAGLVERTGHRYRLPDAGMWEYACRAGTTTPFHFGGSINTDQANYDGNATYGGGQKGTYRERTTPVGSFPANAWGLFDLHGQVWEWCMDAVGIHPSAGIQDPPDHLSGRFRVLRGGSWASNPWGGRSAHRRSSARAYRDSNYGCRVVLCLD
jgi:formylglycine-generating enzyme required for sulfatase activity